MSRVYYLGAEGSGPHTKVEKISQKSKMTLKRVSFDYKAAERETMQIFNLLDRKEIKKLFKQPSHFKKVRCGSNFTLMLDEQDYLYGFGQAVQGQMALNSTGTQQMTQPFNISRWRKMKFCDMACGGSHVLARTKGGKVFGWGEASCGRIGTLEETNALLPVEMPQSVFKQFVHQRITSEQEELIKQLTQQEKKKHSRQLMTELQERLRICHCEFTQIVCGHAHSFIIMSNSVFVLGKDSNGRLGIGPLTDVVKIPTAISYLNKMLIVGVAAGVAHTLAWDDSGQVFSWGSTEFGKLGLPIDPKQDLVHISPFPKHIIDLAEFKIIDACCGDTCSYAVTNTGQLYYWGDVMVVYEQYISKNAPLNHPQNAHEDDENKIGKQIELARPKRLTLLEKDESNVATGRAEIKIIKVRSGGRHFASIDNKHRLLTWGLQEYCLGYRAQKSTPQFQPHPLIVKLLQHRIVIDVDCGTECTVVLAEPKDSDRLGEAFIEFQIQNQNFVKEKVSGLIKIANKKTNMFNEMVKHEEEVDLQVRMEELKKQKLLREQMYDTSTINKQTQLPKPDDLNIEDIRFRRTNVAKQKTVHLKVKDRPDITLSSEFLADKHMDLLLPEFQQTSDMRKSAKLIYTINEFTDRHQHQHRTILKQVAQKVDEEYNDEQNQSQNQQASFIDQNQNKKKLTNTNTNTPSKLNQKQKKQNSSNKLSRQTSAVLSPIVAYKKGLIYTSLSQKLPQLQASQQSQGSPRITSEDQKLSPRLTNETQCAHKTTSDDDQQQYTDADNDKGNNTQEEEDGQIQKQKQQQHFNFQMFQKENLEMQPTNETEIDPIMRILRKYNQGVQMRGFQTQKGILKGPVLIYDDVCEYVNFKEHKDPTYIPLDMVMHDEENQFENEPYQINRDLNQNFNATTLSIKSKKNAKLFNLSEDPDGQQSEKDKIYLNKKLILDSMQVGTIPKNVKVNRQANNLATVKKDVLKHEYMQMIKLGKEKEHLLYLLSNPSSHHSELVRTDAAAQKQDHKLKDSQQILQGQLRESRMQRKVALEVCSQMRAGHIQRVAHQLHKHQQTTHRMLSLTDAWTKQSKLFATEQKHLEDLQRPCSEQKNVRLRVLQFKNRATQHRIVAAQQKKHELEEQVKRKAKETVVLKSLEFKAHQRLMHARRHELVQTQKSIMIYLNLYSILRALKEISNIQRSEVSRIKGKTYTARVTQAQQDIQTETLSLKDQDRARARTCIYDQLKLQKLHLQQFQQQSEQQLELPIQQAADTLENKQQTEQNEAESIIQTTNTVNITERLAITCIQSMFRVQIIRQMSAMGEEVKKQFQSSRTIMNHFSAQIIKLKLHFKLILLKHSIMTCQSFIRYAIRKNSWQMGQVNAQFDAYLLFMTKPEDITKYKQHYDLCIMQQTMSTQLQSMKNSPQKPSNQNQSQINISEGGGTSAAENAVISIKSALKVIKDGGTTLQVYNLSFKKQKASQYIGQFRIIPSIVPNTFDIYFPLKFEDDLIRNTFNVMKDHFMVVPDTQMYLEVPKFFEIVLPYSLHRSLLSTIPKKYKIQTNPNHNKKLVSIIKEEINIKFYIIGIKQLKKKDKILRDFRYQYLNALENYSLKLYEFAHKNKDLIDLQRTKLMLQTRGIDMKTLNNRELIIQNKQQGFGQSGDLIKKNRNYKDRRIPSQQPVQLPGTDKSMQKRRINQKQLYVYTHYIFGKHTKIFDKDHLPYTKFTYLIASQLENAPQRPEYKYQLSLKDFNDKYFPMYYETFLKRYKQMNKETQEQ